MKTVALLCSLIVVTNGGILPDPIITKPGPTAPVIKPETRYEVLDFPNSENPYLRFHIQINDATNPVVERAVRSILPMIRPIPPHVLPPSKPVEPAHPELPQIPSRPGRISIVC